MDIMETARALAEQIRQSGEARDCERLKAIAEEDGTNRALLAEYKRLQMTLQMQAMGGPTVSAEDTQRFSQIASLLYMNGDVQAYLMAEMRLQKMMADVFRILSEAANMGLDMG